MISETVCCILWLKCLMVGYSEPLRYVSLPHDSSRFLHIKNRAVRTACLPHELLRFAKVSTAPYPMRYIDLYRFAMDDKEKVRLLRLHRAACQRNYEALSKYRQQCDAAGRESLLTRMLTGKRVSGIIPPAPEYEPYPDISGLTCGARTRAGTPCKITSIFSNGRCKFHGGRSTGARTKAGRKRQREGYRVWLEKQRASKAGRKRTRTYTDDVQQVSRATLTEIRVSAPGDDLQPVSGISLRRMGDTQLVAELPNGESLAIGLATTDTQFGGIRWWYVCPECRTRRSALFLSGSLLCCRQCAGIHYASQSKSG